MCVCDDFATVPQGLGPVILRREAHDAKQRAQSLERMNGRGAARAVYPSRPPLRFGASSDNERSHCAGIDGDPFLSKF